MLDRSDGRRRLAVVGHPIAHSRSPAIHNAAFEALGLADEWSYEAIDIAPGEFSERVVELPSLDFVGANVTVPHKRAALALADTASDAAGEIGAANMLTFSGGSVAADNTDAPGFLAALPASPAGMRALVLGAGGSARAVVWALVRAGATVAIWNRTPERAERLGQDLGAGAMRADGALPSREFGLIANCTSVGLEATGSDLELLHLSPDGIAPDHVVVDLPYGAEDTELARTARERGARVVDGLELLVRQGAESFRIWTGVDPPLDVMRAAARD